MFFIQASYRAFSLPSEDFLRRSQLGVIRQKIKPLLAEVEDTFKHPGDALPVSSIRFFAHLWLFLTMINVTDELTQSTFIVEKYIEILQVRLLLFHYLWAS